MKKMLNRAIEIALEAHKGQIDKGGKPYILHCLRLMLEMKTRKEMIVAILHDAIEDSSITLNDLRSAGFEEDIIEAIDCLSRRKETETYEDFILRIKKNPLASRVKIADLRDNKNLNRILNPKPEDIERAKKYERAIAILTQ